MSKKNKQDSLRNAGLKWHLDSQILYVSQACFLLLTSVRHQGTDAMKKKI